MAGEDILEQKSPPTIPIREQKTEVEQRENMAFLQSEKRQCSYAQGLMIILVFLLSVLAFGIFHRNNLSYTEPLVESIHKSPVSCLKPAIRKEWRTLSRPEQERYLSAVHCLRARPSMIGLDHSLYDDFPWIHCRNGNYSHRTGDFLPWHRYFLHIYETALKEQCNYRGHLTYWDWGLDWEDIKQSPILSDDLGFGGNGNTSDTKSVAYGHCVTDGPFARLKVLYYGLESELHCLSRGFDDTESTRQDTAKKLKPEALEDVLNAPEYAAFSGRLESDAHDAVPMTIRGDFYRVTAPNDPLFFLHHTQLDRLWWIWQHRDPQIRYTSDPTKILDETIQSYMANSLDLGHLAPAIQASKVVRTETDLLCYGY